MWFVLDNALVLPEYLVEFEYLNNQKAESRPMDPSSLNEECNALFKGINPAQ